jgi:hypothetical protein
MRSSLIAIMVSAAIAAAFAVLTEPVVSAKNGSPMSAANSMSNPTAKGDRLDLRPAGGCLFSRETARKSNNCSLRPAKPALRPYYGLTVVVSLRPVELAPPLIIANAKTIG